MTFKYYDSSAGDYSDALLGRLTQVTGGSGSSYFANLVDYDAMGRLRDEWTKTSYNASGSAWYMGYSYDLAGALVSKASNEGLTLNYGYNSAHQLQSIKDNYSRNLLTSGAYNPLGELSTANYGNNVALSRSYNNRGQLTSLTDGSIYSISPIDYFPDGNVNVANDSINGEWIYNYDEFNRLILANGPGTTFNLLLYSQEIGQSPWTAEDGLTMIMNDSATTDPNRGTTASRLTAPASGCGDVYQAADEDVAPGQTYTFSMWLKAPVQTGATIVVDRFGGYDAETSNITVGTSWQRFTFTHDGTWTSSSDGVVAGVSICSGYIWAWGAQLELGSTEDPYVATTSSPATSGYTYNYDRYGNRWHNYLNGSGQQLVFDFNNHITGSPFVYDAAGNMTNDGNHSYTYDAEGRMVQVDGGSSGQYVYDAFGRRVQATQSSYKTDSIFDADGNEFLRWSDANGWADRWQVKVGNWDIATYDNANIFWEHRDWLGARRAQSDINGNRVGTFTSLPYGDGESGQGNNWISDPFQFAGMPLDTESGLEHTWYRQYSSPMGRWMIPDPAGLGAVDQNNPQTWNRYAYVQNNPINAFDPLGLFLVCDSGTPTFDDQGLATGCAGGGDGGGSDGWDAFSLDPFGGGAGPSGPFWWSITPTTPKPKKPQAANNGTVKCSGSARVLQGNSATIGHPGGFSGPSVGNFPVTANGAAVIPSQWGPSKAFLRPFINQISGVFPNVNYSFTGIVDVMGGAPPPGFPAGSNVQTDLMQLNPGKLILELPGAPQDFGTTAVTITAPSAVGCPAGTVQVP